MNARRKLAAVAVLLVLGLAACGGGSRGGSAAKTTAPTTPAGPTKDATYSTVGDLEKALVTGTGLQCPSPSPVHVTGTTSAESCSDSTVLMVFPSVAERDQRVSELESMSAVTTIYLLIGPNWIINGLPGEVAAAQQVLGGALNP